MSDFDNYIMDHYENQEENMVEEKKPRLTLEEGQALLKVLLTEVKWLIPLRGQQHSIKLLLLMK